MSNNIQIVKFWNSESQKNYFCGKKYKEDDCVKESYMDKLKAYLNPKPERKSDEKYTEKNKIKNLLSDQH